MRKRVFVAESDPDIRTLLRLAIHRLGHDAVERGPADAVVLEPSCAVARSRLRPFGEAVPPVVCLSIFPPEAGLAPHGTVEYLLKPTSTSALGDALQRAFAT